MMAQPPTNYRLSAGSSDRASRLRLICAARLDPNGDSTAGM